MQRAFPSDLHDYDGPSLHSPSPERECDGASLDGIGHGCYPRLMVSTTLLEDYRPALTGHCYRMLGSIVDAEDAVQESMLRAWKGLDRFHEQSSMKTWLYRIATNVCLDVLSGSNRQRLRPLESALAPSQMRDGMTLPQQAREYWVEPIPDVLALPADAEHSPEERTILRESIRLAFVAALKYLPPRQRAVLLLTQVLNWSAA